MRNLLALVGALVIGFGGVGWYMGWYQLNVAKTTEGNLRVETDVNTKKVVTDSHDAVKQLGTFVGEKIDKTGAEAKSDQPANTPGPMSTPKDDKKTGWLPIFGPAPSK